MKNFWENIQEIWKISRNLEKYTKSHLNYLGKTHIVNTQPHLSTSKSLHQQIQHSFDKLLGLTWWQQSTCPSISAYKKWSNKSWTQWMFVDFFLYIIYLLRSKETEWLDEWTKNIVRVACVCCMINFKNWFKILKFYCHCYFVGSSKWTKKNMSKKRRESWDTNQKKRMPIYR